MDATIWVQILDEIVCISLHAVSLEQNINTSFLSLSLSLSYTAMSKDVEQTGLFSLGKETGLEEGKILISKPEILAIATSPHKNLQ